MTDSPGLSEEDARRLLEAIENPAAVPLAAAEPESVPEAAVEPAPKADAGGGLLEHRRAMAGGVMSIAGAAWLGVGAATWATLPCLLGGLFLGLGLWVVLSPRRWAIPATEPD